MQQLSLFQITNQCLPGCLTQSAGKKDQLTSGNVYGQSWNSMVKDLQDEYLQNGLTRQEGMLFYKVKMECHQRGFPSTNIWNRCIQPTYVQRGYPMPISIMDAVGFALYQRCVPFKNDADVMLCLEGMNR